MMKQLISDYFREILLSVLALIFGALAMWATKHDAQEFFKWSSAAAGTLLGALLMLMRSDSAAVPGKVSPAPTPPPPIA